MALPRRAGDHLEYAVPQKTITAAPEGCVYVHLAWFLRRSVREDVGQWIGEWAGYVSAPHEPILRRSGDARLRALDRWTHDVQRLITPYGSAWETVDSTWDANRYESCPEGGAVCLDVTRFGWPVGDHVWHSWDDLHRSLDWPEASGHRFIEIDVATLRVVAQQHSHRPVRDAVPGQKVFDITGTPFERAWGGIHGRFVRRENGLWRFDPSNDVMSSGRPLVLPAERKILTEMPLDLSPLAIVQDREAILLRR